LQLQLVTDVDTASAAGWLTVAEPVVEQLLASVTVTL
jgi:hypothetical protein